MAIGMGKGTPAHPPYKERLLPPRVWKDRGFRRRRSDEKGKSAMALETMKNGRYRVVRPLGSGSTGEVYLVEDILSNRQEKVLKLLYAYASPLVQETQGASRAFRFEAGAIAQLNHPHILPLLDYGAETIDGQVVPFVVTAYCHEGSLGMWLERRSDNDVLTLEDAARLVRQVIGALQYAHNLGVVHRDVKSDNVFIHNNLNGPPDMLVADFGFAKPMSGARASGLDVRGTPEYMAPEQWDGHVVPASDQYALGVVVYQLLTGRLPFQGSIEQLRDAHLKSWPTPPSAINPTLSGEFDVVVRRAMAKKPGDRYPSVSAFADAFAQAIQPAPEPVAPAYLAAPPMPPEEINVGNVTVTSPPPAPARRLSTRMIVLISVLALLVVLVGFSLISNAFSNKSSQSSANATATANAYATATVAPAAQLSGNWVNVDANTLSITKLIITNNGLTVSVQAFAKCPPATTPCDWGTQSAQYSGSPFNITFVVNSRSHNLAITTQGAQLKVVEGIHTYLFNKG
jgi:serine/threonine protein kinase